MMSVPSVIRSRRIASKFFAGYESYENPQKELEAMLEGLSSEVIRRTKHIIRVRLPEALND